MRRFAGACRFVFNRALALQNENHEAGNKYIPYGKMASWLVEWKKEGDKKQPYFIYRADGQAVFIAAIGSTPFERGDEAGRSFCKPAQGLSVTVAMAVRANL